MTDVRNAALGLGMGCLIGLALFYPDQAIWFFAAVAMAALAWALAGEDRGGIADFIRRAPGEADNMGYRLISKKEAKARAVAPCREARQ